MIASSFQRVSRCGGSPRLSTMPSLPVRLTDPLAVSLWVAVPVSVTLPVPAVDWVPAAARLNDPLARSDWVREAARGIDHGGGGA